MRTHGAEGVSVAVCGAELTFKMKLEGQWTRVRTLCRVTRVTLDCKRRSNRAGACRCWDTGDGCIECGIGNDGTSSLSKTSRPAALAPSLYARHIVSCFPTGRQFHPPPQMCGSSTSSPTRCELCLHCAQERERQVLVPSRTAAGRVMGPRTRQQCCCTSPLQKCFRLQNTSGFLLLVPEI